VAGVAALASALVASFLAGSLLAGVAGAVAADLAVGAGATAAGLASAFFSSFLAGSAAKAETAAMVAIRAISCFIVISLIRNVARNLPRYIYNALARQKVYTTGVYSIPVVAKPTKPIVVSKEANSLAATNTSA